MLDIIGIRSLNLDLTATTEKVNALASDKVRDAMQGLVHGAERSANYDDINSILSLLGKDTFIASLGGSAFNMIHAVVALPSGLKTGYVGAAGRTDHRGLSFVQLMQELSIDHTCVSNNYELHSGLCVCVNHKGVRSLLFNPGCNEIMADHLEKNYDKILLYLTDAHMLHITSFTDERTPIILANMM